jgi:putative tricarboxylic transport membrane protein
MEAPKERATHLKQRDILGAVVFFLFGLVTAILSLQMPIGTLRAAGSGLFPLCLGILLMALSSVLIMKVLWGAKEKDKEQSCVPEEPGSPVVVVAFLVIIALATLFLKTLGYAIVSFLLMVALLRLLGVKRWLLNLSLSVLTAAGSHTVFVYLLKIPLPEGILKI